MTTMPLRSESSFFEPLAQPEPEDKQEASQASDWLSGQFRRVPFLLYFFWLILSFAVTLCIAYIMLMASLESYLDPFNILRSYQIIDLSQIIGLLFFLYGCVEMLYSIRTKNSRIAQQSVVKFQYNLTSATMSSGLCMLEKFENIDVILLPLFYFLLTPIIHLIGGHFVLKVFKQNHPLVRRAALQVTEDMNEDDFYEQNEAVTSEISRYNQQLNTWPYFVYKCWLKFAVIFEICIIIGYFVYYFAKDLTRSKILPLELTLLGGLAVLSCLNGFSFFEMEVATRTRALKKCERAIFLLKICTGLSVIAYLFVGIDIWLKERFWMSTLISPYPLWFACIVLVPGVSLFGALKVGKILEERESFVRVSSFTEKCYL